MEEKIQVELFSNVIYVKLYKVQFSRIRRYKKDRLMVMMGLYSQQIFRSSHKNETKAHGKVTKHYD